MRRWMVSLLAEILLYDCRRVVQAIELANTIIFYRAAYEVAHARDILLVNLSVNQLVQSSRLYF